MFTSIPSAKTTAAESAWGIVVRLVSSVWRHHPMIGALAVRDLQSRYAGTFGGMIWTVVHPLAVISVFYVVFAIGFKSQGANSSPFILWFVCGFVPWLFFSETLSTITDSISRHAHLVKKTIFPSEILPLVHLTSGLVAHAIFLLILAGMLGLFNVAFQIDRLLVIYFLFCTCMLVLGLGWLLSAIQVFYRDISQVLPIILNLLFWATPIVWSPDNLPTEYRELLAYNPLYYIIEGYRGMLLYHEAVWPSIWQAAYFWSISIVTFIAGAYVFGRLKPEFADVM
jgi:lipopolysaccharide transport system permease protein/teichoic acid transport system permease protein